MFDLSTWLPALEKFGAVTHLTVIVYAADDRIVCGPFHATPLHTLFARHGYDPRIFDECARRCVSQVRDRQAVVVPLQDGLAVVGAPLVLDGQIVGAAVAGYALVDFVGSSAIEHLARAAGVPFGEIWDIARAQQPIPERRLKLQGELLQVLGEAILRENSRARGSEMTAAALAAESAAKDDFLAVVSHELRTPLTPIVAWARILKLGADPARARHAAEVIERNALLQTRLVDDLLELTRARLGKSALDLRVYDLNEVLRSAIEVIADDIQEKGLAVDVVEAREPLLVEVDEQRVQQILRNVLSNAVKFTPNGGRISVVLAQEGDMAALRIRGHRRGHRPGVHLGCVRALPAAGERHWWAARRARHRALARQAAHRAPRRSCEARERRRWAWHTGDDSVPARLCQLARAGGSSAGRRASPRWAATARGRRYG